MLGAIFNLQGHRGARGLRPENTLPSFEVALDIGVTSIETDLHLSSDGHVILCHDPTIHNNNCRHPEPGQTNAGGQCALVAQMSRRELAEYIADCNPDPARFRLQAAIISPLAAQFAAAHGLQPYGVPTLDDLFEFARCYAAAAGKSAQQRERAARVVFDLELKRVPGRPELLGEGEGEDFNGQSVGRFEERVLECIQRHQMSERTVVRSFDHRSVRALKQREPRLRAAVLVAGTALVAPQDVAQQAGAEIYCPDVEFLDEYQVRQLHAAGIAVWPWTVNEPHVWQRLLAWGVDGVTTDYPDRLAQLLHEHGIEF
jgi:glycerophosphoryl diester phosphodiesterase